MGFVVGEAKRDSSGAWVTFQTHFRFWFQAWRGWRFWATALIQAELEISVPWNILYFRFFPMLKVPIFLREKNWSLVVFSSWNKFPEWKTIRNLWHRFCWLRCLFMRWIFFLSLFLLPLSPGIGGTKKTSERKVWYYPHFSNPLHLQQGELANIFKSLPHPTGASDRTNNKMHA